MSGPLAAQLSDSAAIAGAATAAAAAAAGSTNNSDLRASLSVAVDSSDSDASSPSFNETRQHLAQMNYQGFESPAPSRKASRRISLTDSALCTSNCVLLGLVSALFPAEFMF
jgi:hypothetical protein